MDEHTKLRQQDDQRSEECDKLFISANQNLSVFSEPIIH